MSISFRFLFIVAFSIAFHSGDSAASRILSNRAEEAVIKLRDQLPCGFPQAGIPPLAPLVIDHKELNIDSPALRVDGYLDKFFMNGINDFEIIALNVSVIRSKVTYRLHFNNINVDTWYDIQSYMNKAGLTIDLNGAGHAKFAIKDLEIWGNFKYFYGIFSKTIKLKTLEVRAHIGSVESNIKGILGNGAINKKMNHFLEGAVKRLVNDNEEFITKNIERIFLPIVNGFLRKPTLFDVINDDDSECNP